MAGPALRLLDRHFRWRGHEPTRLEGISDAVFGFSITLLLVSLDVPKSYAALMRSLKGFPPFALCFAILFLLWYEHHKFCRRYALEDRVTLLLTAVLLFVVLFYVYPLKFLFTMMVDSWFGGTGFRAIPGVHQGRVLMIVYGAGVSAVYAVYAGLYANALRHREALELTVVERAMTRTSFRQNALFSSVGLISVALAALVRPQWIGLSGFTYFLFAPFGAINGWIGGRTEARLRREAERAALAGPSQAP